MQSIVVWVRIQWLGPILLIPIDLQSFRLMNGFIWVIHRYYYLPLRFTNLHLGIGVLGLLCSLSSKWMSDAILFVFIIQSEWSLQNKSSITYANVLVYAKYARDASMPVYAECEPWIPGVVHVENPSKFPMVTFSFSSPSIAHAQHHTDRWDVW